MDLDRLCARLAGERGVEHPGHTARGQDVTLAGVDERIRRLVPVQDLAAPVADDHALGDVSERPVQHRAGRRLVTCGAGGLGQRPADGDHERIEPGCPRPVGLGEQRRQPPPKPPS